MLEMPHSLAVSLAAVSALFFFMLCSPNSANSVQLRQRDGHSSSASGSSYAASKTTENAMESANPFLEGPMGVYLARFNIPKSHGAGVYVDLANDKQVKGKSYREAGGKCPVWGKNIELFQPLNITRYKNDFLANVPSDEEAAASGRPLPGGFNNPMKLQDKITFYSPVTLAMLSATPGRELKPQPERAEGTYLCRLGSCKSAVVLTAKTPLGKCAQLAYMTTAGSNSDYRYPFVYDTKNELCYFLFITMQRLWGERYCSNNNKPPGLTWYCFKPNKSVNMRPYLVYGSSYVGQDPDAWEKNCPNKAIKSNVFGVWKDGACVEHRQLPQSTIATVSTKEECWSLAFTNPGVASDHPVTNAEEFGSFEYLFPAVGPNQPKSGGVGVNYASYYGSLKQCALSKEVPTCLVPVEDAVAYTALGSLEEEPLPVCTSTFSEKRGSCDLKKCKSEISSCVDGYVVSKEDQCLPEDKAHCAPNLALIIGLSVAGAILLLLLLGSAFYFHRRKPKPKPVANESRTEYLQEEAAAQRKKNRQSDLVQQAEPSFWEEAADADPESGGENTQVLIDHEY